MQKIFLFLEEVFSVISLLLYSGGPLTVILSGGANEGEEETGASQTDNSLILIIFFVNYLFTIFLIVLRWKQVLSLVKKDKYITLLIALAVLSVIWSSMPGKTINRGIAIVGTTLFGIYLASRYSLKKQLELFGWMYGLAVIFSFVFALILPKYGVMGGIHEGKWRGIYNHKNTLGKVISPGIIIFLLLAFDGKKRRWLFWVGFILAFLLLLRSTATTSLINTITLLAACVGFRVLRWSGNSVVPGLISVFSLGGIFYILISANMESLLASLGKDTTLTGRADLWPYVFEMIWKQPIFGYGYGAFWGGVNSPCYYIWQATNWTPPNSHNGLLDLWLHLGFIGLVIFIFGFFIITLPKAVSWLRFSKTSEGYFPLLYMTYMVLANLGESTLMIQNDLFWVMYVATAFSVLNKPEIKRINY
jgi:O-antigen ligase